ncbi:MAG TPA: DUF4097 family beta strand repeat-containing protein [Candidatus Angelobacter sp.]|nr:DUF4097 family beta strand repeat-containing protein [Candidatus Angelobacter sp.]
MNRLVAPLLVLIAALLVIPGTARSACPDTENAATDPDQSRSWVENLLSTVHGLEDSDDEGEESDTVPQPDTTISVRPGTSLEIENFGGSIEVKTWDKDLVKIAAQHSLRDKVMIVRTGSALQLKVKSRRWVPATVAYRIVAPRWMKLELSGVNTDIDVQDSRAEVRAETVQGDITLRGSTGFASLSSVQGGILAQNVRGRIEASSVNERVRLTNVIGAIYAESVNGGIDIEGATSDSVEASTVNGPVTFEGAVSDQGYYRFATHNGCIDVAFPEATNATLSVSTFSGGIDSSFPVTLKKVRSKRFQTTLGSGKARFELESFQGTIFLRRPGEARQSCDEDNDNDMDSDKVLTGHKVTVKEKTEKVEKAKKSEKKKSSEDEDDSEDGE